MIKLRIIFIKLSTILLIMGFFPQSGYSQKQTKSVPTRRPASTMGSYSFHPLLQVWFINDTLPSTSLNFKIRRAELGFKGQLNEDTRWFVMVDPAQELQPLATGTRLLRDVGVSFRLGGDTWLTAGQFFRPTTAEGFRSNKTLWFAERSFVSRIYGELREPGLMIESLIDSVTLKLMLSTGQGTNNLDTRNEKDLTFRGELAASKEASFGIFTSIEDMSFRRHSIYGLDFNLDALDWHLGVAGIFGHDQGRKDMGATLEFGYTFPIGLQPIIRGEYYRPNFDADAKADSFTVGFNYFMSKHNSKIQLSATSYRGMNGNDGTPIFSASTQNTRHTLCHLSFQIGL